MATIRISEAAHRTLRELADQSGQTMTDILDRAVDAYQRQVFLAAVNAGYAALRSDPKLWAEELRERQLWDTTLMDGLDPDERWTEDGRCVKPGGRETDDGGSTAG